MTNDQIDHLVSARNAITDRTDKYQNMRAVDEIDAILRDVPPGQRADVDALLGRKRVVMVQHVGGAVEVAPEFGPQPAPGDYRIANRPNNLNWRGVMAWFDDAAKTSKEE